MKKEEKKNKRERAPVLLRYPSKEKDSFVEDLSMLISSGMGILPALQVVKVEIRSRYFKKLISRVIDRIENGSSMWRALEKSGIFSGYFISLLRIGEESGRLAENLKILNKQNEKEKIFKSKIRSAMMYPVFVLVLAAGMALGISWFILPKLATIFSGLKIDLPLITEVLIKLGVFFSEEGSWVIPLSIVAIIIIVYILFIFPRTRFLGRSLLFSFPGSKRVIQQVELARFGFVLGTLLEAGLPVTVAFDSLAKATTFPVYRKFYSYMGASLDEGQSFKQAFTGYKKADKLVPQSSQQMINSGQQSGNLSPILLKINEAMEAKIDITTKNLSVILEPILLVIVWLGVVLVAMAVILPIYSLVGDLNQGRGSAYTPPVIPVVDTVVDVSDPIDSPEVINIPETVVEPEPELIVSDNPFGFLNVRSAPSTAGDILERVSPGDRFTFTALENNWYEIVLEDGGSGWVFGDYIEEIEYE